MNKLIRFILYITAGCIGVGTAALVSGLVLGGGHLSWEEDWIFGRAEKAVQKITADHEKRVQTVEKAETTVTDYGVDTDSYEEDYDYEETEFSGDIGLLTVDASSIQDLNINLQHGYLHIEESDDNRICVSVSGSGNMIDDVQAVCESGCISISDQRTGNSARKDVNIYLQLPEDIRMHMAEFRINAGYLDSDCRFAADNLTVNADAGQIDLSDVSADQLFASVGAGAITIDDSSFTSVNLECGVGVMDIEADVEADSQIECGMGAVNLELQNGLDSVNYVFHCGAGTIQIGDRSYSGIAKKSRIENGSQATFTLECGMGQICIDD